jgi:histidine triad (HIT) family protein
MEAGEVTECVVCRKHRGAISEPGGATDDDDGVVRAGHRLLDPDGESAYLGYLFIEPNLHAPGLADLTNDEARALGALASRLSRALVQCAGADHVYAFVFGDHVPHLHVHIVPRYPNTPREYWGVEVNRWPEAPRGGHEAIASLCDRLRDYLAKT